MTKRKDKDKYNDQKKNQKKDRQYNDQKKKGQDNTMTKR